jgi:predicted metal-binding protein
MRRTFKMVRKISANVPEDVLKQDLENYRQTAIELGAADAKIITTDKILIDERVRAKCFVPSCGSVGKNAHCPPNALDLDFVRKVISNFQYAIFYMLKVPSIESAGPDYSKKRLGEKPAKKNWEISSKIESKAFYDGYHLAVAFSGGPCEPYLCANQACSLLAGEGCRNPLQARPSMEAVGMDAFIMAANVGWEVYPIGRSLSPSDIPHGTRLGLVLIY